MSLKRGELRHVLSHQASTRPSRRERQEFRERCRFLYARRAQEEENGVTLAPGPRFKAEIQVRTLLQHTWAALGHDRIYKGEFAPPERLQRDVNRTAALLEEADEDLARTMRDVDGYMTYYGAYMPRERREQERDKLKAILPHDRRNVQLALKLARLHGSLEEWPEAEATLAPFVRRWERSARGRLVKRLMAAASGPGDEAARARASQQLAQHRDRVMGAVLLDYGRGTWERTKNTGREYLRLAIALAPDSVAARAALAETFLDSGGTRAALRHYGKAFETEPADPRALSGFVYCRILTDGRLGFLESMRPSLEAGIERCRARARVGVDLPRAYYDAGLFALLLGRPYESLAYYAKAVQLGDSPAAVEPPLERVLQLETALRRRRRTGGKAGRVLRERLADLACVHRLLVAAKVAKLHHAARAAAHDVQARRVDRQRKKLAVDELRAHSADLRARLGRREFLRQRRALHKELAESEQACRDAVRCRRKCAAAVRAGAERYLSDLVSARVPKLDIDKPVVIVAGGCDADIERRMKEFRTLLQHAFDGFRGTILSAGTRAGIGTLVGDLVTPCETRKIACLPRRRPSWAVVHPAYEIYYSAGANFSALEPVQTWVDLLGCGYAPWDIRVLGINGGEISGLEFRLALAMGARVGVLRDSGRAAGRLAQDPEWHDSRGLCLLPYDPETTRIFVQDPAPSPLLRAHREDFARQVHEKYRENERGRLTRQDPATADWEALAPDLRASNLHQVDNWEQILRAVGLTIRKATRLPIVPLDLQADKWQATVERMSEMEHGRWNVERFLRGWRWAEKKDVARKTSPYLVPWSKLPDEIKEYDRRAMRNLPLILAEKGYQVVPL